MKGIYILLISIAGGISVSVGALGDKSFQKGLYVYAGSAQNNLEKRVKRHLRKVKRKFWHIDYLLCNRHAKVVKVLYKEAGRLEECRVAERLYETATPIRGFGSSGCRCKGHLFMIEARDYLSEFMREIGMKPFRGWSRWRTLVGAYGLRVCLGAVNPLFQWPCLSFSRRRAR
jgi:Uri superfamily endonuclease